MNTKQEKSCADMNAVRPPSRRNSRHELATGLTDCLQRTKKPELFAEWDAFYPTAGVSAALGTTPP